MKNFLRFFGLVFLALTLAFVVQVKTSKAKTYHFTYSNFFPPTHIQSKLAAAWCKQVEKKTNGHIKIAYYPGSTLVKAAQIYDGVVSDRTDIGMSCLLYTRGRFPLMDVINLPFGNPSGQFATAVVNEIYHKFKPKELSDTHVLYLYAHGPGLIHTKDKAVRTMADLKGLKIRAPGSVAGMIRALGATPVTMPMPEVYQALQRGVVDGAVYPEETNKGWKMAEVIHNDIACYPIAYSVGFFVVMNKAKWNVLPKKYRKIITALNKEWAVKTGRAWDTSDYAGMKFSLGLGNTIIGIKPAEAQKWKKAIQPVFDEYLSMTKKKGLPGKAVLNYLDKRLKAYKKGNFVSEY